MRSAPRGVVKAAVVAGQVMFWHLSGGSLEPGPTRSSAITVLVQLVISLL